MICRGSFESIWQYYKFILIISYNFFKKNSYFCCLLDILIMLQRIQTVYLIVVTILAGALPFWLTLYTDANGKQIYAANGLFYSIVFLLIAFMAFITVFFFKNRKLQFVLNRLNIILNVTLLGFFVYRSLNLSGEIEISEKGIGMFIPVISIVFLVLANKAIKRDEDLVKSVDRLR